MFVVVVLILAGAGWHFGGWPAAVVALSAGLMGMAAGIEGIRKQVEAAGYVMEYRKDGTGRSRWRVGVKRTSELYADPVEWIVPTRATTKVST